MKLRLLAPKTEVESSKDRIKKSFPSLTEKQLDDLSKINLSFKAAVDADQVVYGEVYCPLEVDTQNDFATADVIKEMAWNFLASGKVSKVDVSHDFKESGSVVVESFIARAGDPIFTEGAWVLASKLPDDLWAKVLKGELNGYSLAGFLTKFPVTVDVNVEARAEGETETVKTDNIEEHSHPFVVLFDPEGDVLFGEASKGENDHKHVIIRTTATEKAKDHQHRFVV